MKAKKIWIAIHSKDPTNYEVSLTEPGEDGIYLYSTHDDYDDDYAPYKEYLVIEIGDFLK
jgi:hypothetical protein